jgi:hypothetical protein
MRQGDLLQVDIIRQRILTALEDAAISGATR